jgi:hypothetical protein
MHGMWTLYDWLSEHGDTAARAKIHSSQKFLVILIGSSHFCRYPL